MRRFGFTLVEILVSVALIGLISIYTASLINQTKQDGELFQKRIQQDREIESIDETLYRDIFQAESIEVKNSKTYDILYLKSENSIYGIERPYVVWLVLKKDNTLIRMESSREIELPIREEDKRYVFIDDLSKDCESFSVNLTKGARSVLYFAKIKGKKPILYEIKKL